jgi:hypothetical protein
MNLKFHRDSCMNLNKAVSMKFKLKFHRDRSICSNLNKFHRDSSIRSN